MFKLDDCVRSEFSDEQLDVAKTLAERGSVTIWSHDDGTLIENGSMGLQLVEDGASQIAFFDRTGTIVGDWIV